MSQSQPLENKKLLVTGPTGQVADPVARALAGNNEVWSTARFTDAAKKASLEADGVKCISLDLDSGDFSTLPNDFDYVLNFAVVKTQDFDHDLRCNGESTGLLMSHCRNAKAFLHCSTTGVYQPKGHDALSETDELGDNHRVMMPTYSIAKISAEVVARFAAREFELPTIITRLNVPYGNNGGWPFMHLMMMKSGVPIPVHSDSPSVYTPIHEDDIIAMLPGLLDAASIPANIVNLCGSEDVTIEDWCQYMGELTNLVPEFTLTQDTLESVRTDSTKLHTLVNEAQVDWREGLHRMIEALSPELLTNR
ncbi:NAD(P)-dependent oxidoreductase [Myxococcota bacterium]|nr:NAD(P)-dependent oxidoreductase [Myxococcota bacterium]